MNDPQGPVPGPQGGRWEAIVVAATFGFGGGLVSLALVGLAWLTMGPSFSWPLVSSFVTLCLVAVAIGAPILVIDRIRTRTDR